MKHFFLIFIAVIFGILTHAQTQYEISGDGNNKILKGIVTRELIRNDPAFGWMQQDQSENAVDLNAIAALKANREKIRLMVFAGTWSEPSKKMLPDLFSLLDAANFPESRLTLIGVDSNYRSIGDNTASMNITTVPTLIVFEDGKEIGRINGLNSSPVWERELGELLNTVH